MKRIFTLALILFITNNLFAQQKIEGIGKFKIGQTTPAIIKSLAAEFSLDIRETNDVLETMNSDYSDNPTKIIYISKEQNEDKIYQHSRYVDHPKVKVYYINRITIADMVLTDVYLEFYRDTLYSLECHGFEELDTALQIKYGNPKISSKTKPIQCTNAYRSVTYEEKTYTKEWTNPSKKIRATSTISIYYNSKCEKQYLSMFLLYKEPIESRIFKETQAIKEKASRDRSVDRQKALTEF